MTFISWQFLAFFIVVTSLYYVLTPKWRWLLLLIAGCIFYISFIPVYILLLFLLITIDYFIGIRINQSKGRLRTTYLIISILATLAVLFVFKYFNFFVDNFRGIAFFLGWNYPISTLKIILPIGLSFHTFQSLAYTIEVYRKKQKVERHYGIYALYVMFYPQLMAGPIERPYNMLHQFHEEHEFDYKEVVGGLRLMLWGAFQKVIIADRAAVVVNMVYSKPEAYSSLVLVVSTVLFSFQIFCDFAGYSNIAIGAARVMGFQLMKNFDRPYLATSIADFWRRWHISLSTWFRDYFYIPLGGNRVSWLRKAFNIMATFVVSGFWHGANWTFVIWGAIHGYYLLVFMATKSFTKKFLVSSDKAVEASSKFLGSISTFLLVTFAWIFFRAESLDKAFYIVVHLFANLNRDVAAILKTNLTTLSVLAVEKKTVLGLTIINWIILTTALLVMTSIHRLQNTKNVGVFFDKIPLALRWAAYYVLILFIFYFAAQSREQFLYFQF